MIDQHFSTNAPKSLAGGLHGILFELAQSPFMDFSALMDTVRSLREGRIEETIEVQI